MYRRALPVCRANSLRTAQLRRAQRAIVGPENRNSVISLRIFSLSLPLLSSGLEIEASSRSWLYAHQHLLGQMPLSVVRPRGARTGDDVLRLEETQPPFHRRPAQMTEGGLRSKPGQFHQSINAVSPCNLGMGLRLNFATTYRGNQNPSVSVSPEFKQRLSSSCAMPASCPGCVKTNYWKPMRNINS